MKQETLEQAAEKEYPLTPDECFEQETIEEANWKVLGTKNNTFYNGAKWQAERMYSEEDMISFAHFYFTEEFNSSMQTSKSTKDIFNEWFKQFKNK
jgi:hypothetical protein